MEKDQLEGGGDLHEEEKEQEQYSQRSMNDSNITNTNSNVNRHISGERHSGDINIYEQQPPSSLYSSSILSTTLSNSLSDVVSPPTMHTPGLHTLDTTVNSSFVLERSGSSRKRLRAQTIRNRNIQLNTMAIQHIEGRNSSNDLGRLSDTSSQSQTVSSLSDFLRKEDTNNANERKSETQQRFKTSTSSNQQRGGIFIRRSLSTPMGTVDNSGSSLSKDKGVHDKDEDGRRINKQTTRSLLANLVFRPKSDNDKGLQNQDYQDSNLIESRAVERSGDDKEGEGEEKGKGYSVGSKTTEDDRHVTEDLDGSPTPLSRQSEENNREGDNERVESENNLRKGALVESLTKDSKLPNLTDNSEKLEQEENLEYEKNIILSRDNKENEVNSNIGSLEETSETNLNFRPSINSLEEHGQSASIVNNIRRQLSVPLQVEFDNFGETFRADQTVLKEKKGEEEQSSQKKWTNSSLTFICECCSTVLSLTKRGKQPADEDFSKGDYKNKCFSAFWWKERFYFIWIYIKSALRYFVRELPRKYFRSHTWQYIQTFFIILSFVAYVVETYYPLYIVLPYIYKDSGVQVSFSNEYIQYFWCMVGVEILFSIIFSIDLVMNLLIARSPVRYIFSFGGIVDLLAILPGFLILTQVSYNGGALPRLLKIARILRVSKTAIGDRDTLHTQIMRAILHVLVAIIISAGLVNALESEMEEPQYSEKLRWFDALYYTVVTMSTVGYGEIHPITIWSRLLAVGIVVTAICLIPYEAGRLIDALYRAQIMSHYNVALKDYERHIVIAGHLDHVHLRRLLQELFHGIYSNYDHPDMMDVKGVILQQGRPDKNMESILNMFGNRLTYLAGSPHFFEDLQRARVEKAKAIFILSQKPSYEGSDNEDRLVLYALALRQYLALHYEKQQKAYFLSRINKRRNKREYLEQWRQENMSKGVDFKNVAIGDEDEEDDEDDDEEEDINRFHVQGNTENAYNYAQFLHKDNNKSRSSKLYTPKVLIQLNTTKAKEQVKYATAQMYKQYYNSKSDGIYGHKFLPERHLGADFQQNSSTNKRPENDEDKIYDEEASILPKLSLPQQAGEALSNIFSPKSPMYGLSSYNSPTRGKSAIQARNQALGYRNSQVSQDLIKSKSLGNNGKIELTDFKINEGQFWSSPRKKKRLKHLQLKLYSPDQHILCLSELKLALIAYGTVFRGFLALVINLLRSLPTWNNDNKASRQSKEFWQSSYRRGGTHTIYTVDLSAEKYPQLYDKTFSDIMKYLYREHKLLAIGCQTKSNEFLPSDRNNMEKHRKSIFHTYRVLINPGKSFRIPKEGSCIFFIMATSYKSVYNIIQDMESNPDFMNTISPRHHASLKSRAGTYTNMFALGKEKSVKSKDPLDNVQSEKYKGKQLKVESVKEGEKSSSHYRLDINFNQERIGAAGTIEDRMKIYAKLSRKAFFNERLIERYNKLLQINYLRRKEQELSRQKSTQYQKVHFNNEGDSDLVNKASKFDNIDFGYANLNNTSNSNSSLVIVDINQNASEMNNISPPYSPGALSIYKHPSILNVFSEYQDENNENRSPPLLSPKTELRSEVFDEGKIGQSIENVQSDKNELSSQEKNTTKMNKEVAIKDEEKKDNDKEILDSDSCSTNSDSDFHSEKGYSSSTESSESEEERGEAEEDMIKGSLHVKNKNNKTHKIEDTFVGKPTDEGIRSVVDGFLSEDVWLEMKELASKAKVYLKRIRNIEEENKLRLMEGKDPISHGDPQRQRLINLSLLAMHTLEEYTNVHCFISREAVATAQNHILICVCSTGSSYKFLSHLLIPLGRCTNSPIVIMGNNSSFFGPVLSGLNKRAVSDPTVRATGIYFFEGDPSNIDDLITAQVLNAQRVVLLGGDVRDLEISDASSYRSSSNTRLALRDHNGAKIDGLKGAELYPLTRERTESFHRPRSFSSSSFGYKDRASSIDTTNLLEIEENDALGRSRIQSRLQQEPLSRSRRANKYSNKQPAVSNSLNGDRQVLIVAGILECLMSGEEYEKIHIITDLNMDFNANHLKQDCVVLESENLGDMHNVISNFNGLNARNRDSKDWDNFDEYPFSLVEEQGKVKKRIPLSRRNRSGQNISEVQAMDSKYDNAPMVRRKNGTSSSSNLLAPSSKLTTFISKEDDDHHHHHHHQTISTTSGVELRRDWMQKTVRQRDVGNRTQGLGIGFSMAHQRGRSAALFPTPIFNALASRKNQSFSIEREQLYQNSYGSLGEGGLSIGRRGNRTLQMKGHQLALSHIQQDVSRATGINSTYESSMKKYRAVSNVFAGHESSKNNMGKVSHPFYQQSMNSNSFIDENLSSYATNMIPPQPPISKINPKSDGFSKSKDSDWEKSHRFIEGESNYRFDAFFVDKKFKPLTSHQGSMSSDAIHYEELFDWPLVAAGRLCPQSLLDILLVRMFYNPMDLEFWKAILNIHHGNNFDQNFVATRLHPSAETGHIDQFSIPEDMVGKSYEAMTEKFMEDDILCLGLYRRRGRHGAPMPFTQLSPPELTPLASTDMVFVLMPPKRKKNGLDLLNLFDKTKNGEGHDANSK